MKLNLNQKKAYPLIRASSVSRETSSSNYFRLACFEVQNLDQDTLVPRQKDQLTNIHDSFCSGSRCTLLPTSYKKTNCDLRKSSLSSDNKSPLCPPPMNLHWIHLYPSLKFHWSYSFGPDPLIIRVHIKLKIRVRKNHLWKTVVGNLFLFGCQVESTLGWRFRKIAFDVCCLSFATSLKLFLDWIWESTLFRWFGDRSSRFVTRLRSHCSIGF